MSFSVLKSVFICFTDDKNAAYVNGSSSNTEPKTNTNFTTWEYFKVYE